MFAETWRGVDRQNLLKGEPARALALEDAQLVVVAAVAGDRIEHDVRAQRSRAQLSPCTRSAGTEPQRTTEAIAPAKLQGNRFGDQLQTGLLNIAVCSESQLAQSALQSVDRKHVVEDLAGAATGGLQTVQRVIQPGSRASRGINGIMPCGRCAAR